MSNEENEFIIPFSDSRKGRDPDLEEKALGRRLASYASRRLADRPTLGRRRGGSNVDLPTGGKPGTRNPTGSRRDVDGDGWADEGTTKPIYVGINRGEDKTPGKPQAFSSGSEPSRIKISRGANLGHDSLDQTRSFASPEMDLDRLKERARDLDPGRKYDSILEIPGIEQPMEEIFGTPDWEEVKKILDAKKKRYYEDKEYQEELKQEHAKIFGYSYRPIMKNGKETRSAFIEIYDEELAYNSLYNLKYEIGRGNQGETGARNTIDKILEELIDSNARKNKKFEFSGFSDGKQVYVLKELEGEELEKNIERQKRKEYFRLLKEYESMERAIEESGYDPYAKFSSGREDPEISPGEAGPASGGRLFSDEETPDRSPSFSSGAKYQELVDSRPELTQEKLQKIEELKELLRSDLLVQQDEFTTVKDIFDEDVKELADSPERSEAKKRIHDLLAEIFNSEIELEKDIVVTAKNGEKINLGKTVRISVRPGNKYKGWDVGLTDNSQKQTFMDVNLRMRLAPSEEAMDRLEKAGVPEEMLENAYLFPEDTPERDRIQFGSSSRSIVFNTGKKDSDITISHDTFFLNEPSQGLGIGSLFNANNEKIYNAIGAKRIVTLGASSKEGNQTGATHWPKNGFTWAGEKAKQDFLFAIRYGLLDVDIWFSEEERKRISPLIEKRRVDGNLVVETNASAEELLDFKRAASLFQELGLKIRYERRLGNDRELSGAFSSGREKKPKNQKSNMIDDYFGPLGRIGNFHASYSLKKDKKNNQKDFSSNGDFGVFSSGKQYEEEVEQRKLIGERLINALNVKKEIENYVLPKIHWKDNALNNPNNDGINQIDRVSYLEFAEDENLHLPLIRTLSELFSKDVPLSLNSGILVKDKNGKEVDLGSELLVDFSVTNLFAVDQYSSRLSSKVADGSDLFGVGESINVYVAANLKLPENSAKKFKKIDKETETVGSALFNIQITGNGTDVVLNTIETNQNFRNAGIARSLVADLENTWDKMGVSSFYLTGISSLDKKGKTEFNGASYWGLNGFEWDGSESRSKMLSAIYEQIEQERNKTSEKNYFTQSERERLLGGFSSDYDDSNEENIYSSFSKPEDVLSLADKDSFTKFFSERDNGEGIVIDYKRVINKEKHSSIQKSRLKKILDDLPEDDIDRWSTGERSSRNSSTKNKAPVLVKKNANINWLSGKARDNSNKFSSGENTKLQVHRYGKDTPFDQVESFTVKDKKFRLSRGGDSPGRNMYNGYIAAFSEDGTLAGYIDYNTDASDKTATVAMVEVNKDFARNGIGTALLDSLRIDLPDYEIDAGYTTEQGAKWWRAATGGPGPVKGPRRSASLTINDMRDTKTNGEKFSSGKSENPFSPDEDYRGMHEAPDRNSGAPMHNISDGIYPDDIYGPNGAEWYASGDPLAKIALSMMKRIRNKPESLVTIYRAIPLSGSERLKELEAQKAHIVRYARIPKGVQTDIADAKEYYDEISREIDMLRNAKHLGEMRNINAGDWVSPVRDYAKHHGNLYLGGKGKYRVLSKRVKAKHLFTEGNSLLEFGYDPDDNPRRLSSGEVKIPSFPREPSYGPFIGEAEFVFGDAKTWSELRDAFNSREIIFIDYETTGLAFDRFREPSSNGKPVQIALVKMRNGKVVDEINLFMNPTEPLGEWSRQNLYRTDGEQLTDEWLSQQMSIQEAHRAVAEFAGPGAIMGVQNAKFDKNVLEDALAEAGITWRPSGYIDSLDIAQMILPKYSEENKDGPSVVRGETRVASTTLSALAEYLEVRLDRHHSAEQDATAAGMVMYAMLNQAESRGWDSRILNRAQREDFLDERTKKFQTAREEFDAAKRRFINFENETARFSSGKDDRPILDTGIPSAKPDRDRPIIKIDPLLKPLRRDELEQLKRHQSRDYKYGQVTELGVELRVSTPGFLRGLSSSQIANLMVPSSEDEYMEIIFDMFPIPPSNSATPEKLRKALRKQILDLMKLRSTEPDFSPQNVNILRKALEESLNASPELKWLMETFGSPPIVKNMNTDGEGDGLKAGAWLDQLVPTLAIVQAWDGFKTGRTSQGELGLTSEFDLGSTTIMDRSVSGVFKHELIHYIHMQAMIEANLGDVFDKRGTLPYRDLKATRRQYIPDYGTAGGRSARYRGLRVAEEYYSYEPLPNQQRVQQSVLARDPNGAGFDERWLNLTAASTAHSYGNTNLVEALAEGCVAVLHQDPTVQERWITKKLRDDARAFLGLLDGEAPWKEIEERDRAIRSTSIGANLRTAARDRLDVARDQVRNIINMRFSSGADHQRRIPEETRQSSSSKLNLVNNPKGRDRSGPASSLAMEMLGPNSRELIKNENSRFSSGGAAQVYSAGDFDKKTQKKALSNVYQDSNGNDVRMRGEVHAIGKDKIYFGHIPEKIKSQITDKEIKIIPLNPYLISGLSPTSAEGRDMAIRWIAARAARYESSGDQASTYVDALLYAGMRGDADSMLEFEDLAKKGELLIEEKRRVLTEGKGLSPAQIKYFQASADEKGIGNLSIDDLYVVHETTYDIVRDEAGNVLLRPTGDYGYIPTEDGGVYKHHRQTIHFTLNHLARGHSFRERKSKSNIIVTPLRSVIEDNPGALENLFVIDSWFVPEPEKPLVLRGSTVLEKNESTENIDEDLRQLLLSFGTTGFSGGETSSNDHQDLKVGQIASELMVTAMGHYNSTPHSIERITDDELDLGKFPTDPITWAVMSDNHRARVANTSDRFITHDEYEEGREGRRSFASGAVDGVNENTGRTIGGISTARKPNSAMLVVDENTGRIRGGYYNYSPLKRVLRSSSKRTGISKRERDRFNARRARFSSGDDNSNRIGTVSKEPVAVVAGKVSYFVGTESNSRETRVQVYDINGEQVAFTKGVIEAPGVKRLLMNPYAITNTSPKSKDGREFARLWFMASVGQANEDKKLEARTSALLYAYARGDSEAGKELKRLSSVGEKILKEKRTQHFSSENNIVAGTTPEQRTSKWWKEEALTVLPSVSSAFVNQGYGDLRALELRDIHAVHETVYKPKIDKDGNLVIRPNGDFDVIDEKTGKPHIDQNTNEPLRTSRGTIHFALNHLALGHLYRQSPTETSYAIVIQLEKLIEANPNSVDNIFRVDTYFTPGPEDGLIFPAGSFKVVELPSVVSHSGVNEPDGGIYNATPEKAAEYEKAILDTLERRKELVNEELKRIGQVLEGNEDYRTPIFPGGEGGAQGLDVRLKDLAYSLGADSRMHDSSVHYKLEFPLADGSDSLFDALSTDVHLLNENSILRFAHGNRLTTRAEKYYPELSASEIEDSNSFFSGAEKNESILPMSESAARAQIASSGMYPDKIEIPQSWFTQQYPMGELASRFPDMHLRRRRRWGNSYTYVPATGELNESSDAVDELNDASRMADFLNRSNWHPGIVEAGTELAQVMDMWRSDFSESRNMTRRLSGLSVSESAKRRGREFDDAVELLRNGLASAPPVGQRTYRVARLTPDVGTSTNIGDELNFSAASVAVGIDNATAYELDELSQVANMPDKIMFRFPEDARGIFFDEQGLKNSGRPSAAGGDYGPVEGIVSGSFRVTGIEKEITKSPFGKKYTRDVVVLEKINEKDKKLSSGYVVTDDSGTILFSPGKSEDLELVQRRNNEVTSLSVSIRKDYAKDILKIPKPTGVPFAGSDVPPELYVGFVDVPAISAKQFVTKNISESIPMSAREISKAISDIEDTVETLAAGKISPYTTVKDSFYPIIDVLENIEQVGYAKAFLRADNASDPLSISQKKIAQVEYLDLETRKKIQEKIIEPIIKLDPEEIQSRLSKIPTSLSRLSYTDVRSIDKIAYILFGDGVEYREYKQDEELNDYLKQTFQKVDYLLSTIEGILSIYPSFGKDRGYTESIFKKEKARLRLMDGVEDSDVDKYAWESTVNKLTGMVGGRFSYDRGMDFIEGDEFQIKYFGGRIIDSNNPEFEQELKKLLISKFVKSWATTANDSNPLAMLLQNAARNVFNRSDAVGWDLSSREGRQISPNSPDVTDAGREKIKKDIDTNMALVYDSAPKSSPETQKFLEQFLQAMHKSTQEYYRSKGITHIPLFRGMTIKPGEQSLPSPTKGRDRPFTAAITSRPLSSWSTSLPTAMDFTRRTGSEDFEKDSYVLFSYFPVEEILANPLTGFGCLSEDECVVLGGTGKAIFRKVLDAIKPDYFKDEEEDREDPFSAGQAKSRQIINEMGEVEFLFITGEKDWEDFENKEITSTANTSSSSGRENVGVNRFSSGGLSSYVKDPAARAVIGLDGKTTKKLIDEDFRLPTDSLEVAKKEGRPISWLLNETIDDGIGVATANLIDKALSDELLTDYFESNDIHPYASIRIPEYKLNPPKYINSALTEIQIAILKNHPELVDDPETIYNISSGMLARALTAVTRTLWVKREAAKLNMEVSELLEKMKEASQRLIDFQLLMEDLNEVTSFIGESNFDTFRLLNRGPNAKDRIVVAVDLPAILTMMGGEKDQQRILSQFESNRSNGAYNLDGRKIHEVAQFAYHPDMDPKLRPVYGFAAYGGISESMREIGPYYGEFLVVMKDRVNSRATVTEVDSLSTISSASSFNSPGLGMLAMSDQFVQDEVASPVGYLEAQIHSKNGEATTSVEDIQYILIRGDLEDILDNGEDPDDFISQMENALGVPVRFFDNEIYEGIESEYNEMIYIDEEDAATWKIN